MSELWTAVAALAAVAAVVTPVLMVLRTRRREAKRPAHEKACDYFDQLDRMSAAVTRRSFTKSELDGERFDDLLGDLEVVERKTFDGWRTRNAAVNPIAETDHPYRLGDPLPVNGSRPANAAVPVPPDR